VANEVARESARVTGTGAQSGAGGERSFASQAADFTRLVLDKEFADRMLATALAALDQARSEAQRKQLYLERIVQPTRPDRAMEPRRLRAIAATALAAALVWGVLVLLVASIREHMD
jgi:capsular polysaccharide transport system permease protein